MVAVMKKILSTLCLSVALALVVSSSAMAAGNKVAMILDAPVGMFSEPEKVYAAVETSFNTIVGNASRYEIVSTKDTESYVQIYREENDMIETVNNDGYSGNSTQEGYLKKSDIDKICQHFESDYVIYIRVATAMPRMAVGWFDNSQKINVTLDYRVWSNAKKDFSYTKRTTNTGKSTAIYAGFGSSARAVDKGIKKGLEEVEKEAVKVKAALSE